MHEMTLDEMIACVEGDAKYWEECTPHVPENAEEMQCIARFLKRLKWLPITDEQRSPTVDDDLFLTDGRRFGVGNNHSGEWEIAPKAYDFEIVHGWTPTHYMPLDALPPVPKETTPNDN